MNKTINKRVNQLTELFNKIKKLDNEELSHLYELVSLHNESLFIVGSLVSESLYVRDLAYTDRKRIFSELILSGSGTVADKQAHAELAIVEYRKLEAEANSMYSKYKLMYDALNHRLIDYRQKKNKLEEELKLINDRGL